jgi:hypothetical protein
VYLSIAPLPHPSPPQSFWVCRLGLVTLVYIWKLKGEKPKILILEIGQSQNTNFPAVDFLKEDSPFILN